MFSILKAMERLHESPQIEVQNSIAVYNDNKVAVQVLDKNGASSSYVLQALAHEVLRIKMLIDITNFRKCIIQKGPYELLSQCFHIGSPHFFTTLAGNTDCSRLWEYHKEAQEFRDPRVLKLSRNDGLEPHERNIVYYFNHYSKRYL